MNPPTTPLVVVVAALAATTCSNFRPRGEGATVRAMSQPSRWSPYDDPSLPPPRQYASVTPVPGGAILFGGIGAGGPLAEGWRWDGARWRALPSHGAPAARSGHVAAWTGDALCVWGGAAGRVVHGDGACWDEGRDAWRAMSGEGAPSPRAEAASAMTAQGWLVWGGRDDSHEDLGDGALYDPARDVWRPLPDGGPRPRHGACAATSPDGERVLVWGGAGEALALGAEDAAILDLASWRWTPLALDGAPRAGGGPLGVVVPAGLVAVGPEDGAVFEWSTGRWRPIERAPTAGRWGVAVASTPVGVVVWGGREVDGARADGATLDLASGRWQPLPSAGAPDPRVDALAVVDDHQVLVLWGVGPAGLRADGIALR